MLQLPETAKLQPRPTCMTAHSGAAEIISPRMGSDAVAQPQPLLCLQPCALAPSGAAGTAAARALSSTFWRELQGCPRACAHFSRLCRGLHTGCVHSRLAPHITDAIIQPQPCLVGHSGAPRSCRPGCCARASAPAPTRPAGGRPGPPASERDWDLQPPPMPPQ